VAAPSALPAKDATGRARQLWSDRLVLVVVVVAFVAAQRLEDGVDRIALCGSVGGGVRGL